MWHELSAHFLVNVICIIVLRFTNKIRLVVYLWLIGSIVIICSHLHDLILIHGLNWLMHVHFRHLHSEVRREELQIRLNRLRWSHSLIGLFCILFLDCSNLHFYLCVILSLSISHVVLMPTWELWSLLNLIELWVHQLLLLERGKLLLFSVWDIKFILVYQIDLFDTFVHFLELVAISSLLIPDFV